jgi:alkyl hydroperoxide reductase subunit AhpC
MDHRNKSALDEGCRTADPGHRRDRAVWRRAEMAFRIGDFVPNFWQDSSQGLLNLYNYGNGDWIVLFSYPKDFTASTSEIASAARHAPDFSRCGARLLGLSVDPADSHRALLKELESRHGLRVDFPLIADSDRKICGLLGLIDPDNAARLARRFTLIISPNKQLRLAQAGPATAPQDFAAILRLLESMQRPAGRPGASCREPEYGTV